MRKIKFRAWDKTMNKMIYQSDTEFEFRLTGKGIEVDDLTFVDTAFNEKHEDIDCEVMQSTGLEDKNGTEIYEGDIVEFKPWNREETENYIVKFISDDASFRGIKEKKSSIKVLSLINSEQGLKVIGNIHANPELLELKNDI